MENKRTRIEGSDIDKAVAKVGRSKTNKLKTDEPLDEQKRPSTINPTCSLDK